MTTKRLEAALAAAKKAEAHADRVATYETMLSRIKDANALARAPQRERDYAAVADLLDNAHEMAIKLKNAGEQPERE